MTRPRVLLADDHQMLAGALRLVLEPHCEVVGAVSDGRALLEAAARLQPDIVVLDISMPQLNGLDAGRQLKHSWPKIKLIYMTMHGDPDLVGESFRAGGSAFLLKEAVVSELTEAIDKVLKGGLVRHPERGGRLEPDLVARTKGPGPCPGTHSPAAGSIAVIGGGAVDERGSLRTAHYQTHCCLPQIRRNGTLKPEVQLRACAVRHPAQNLGI
jgi:CheY-like chemotaxis protein